MHNEVYVLGAFSQKRFFLLGYELLPAETKIPVYESLNEAKNAFMQFNFLFDRLPSGITEEHLLKSIQDFQPMVYGIPKHIVGNLLAYINYFGYEPQSLHWLNVNDQPAIPLPLRTELRLASKYAVYHLLFDILHRNEAIPSLYRKMLIGNDLPTDDKFGQLADLIKRMNAN